MISISIDAMGNDHGPEIVVEALNKVASRYDDLLFRVYGHEEILKPLLEKNPAAQKKSLIIHCESMISMEDNPTDAVQRKKRQSSMWQAIESIRNNESKACVSAGNTGALMAVAKVCLSSLPGVARPALAALWPNIRGVGIVLDVGATVRVNALQLTDFAILGASMARVLWEDKKIPSVGLLNVGTEEHKGYPEIQEANKNLRSMNLPFFNYKGFIEGNDITKGIVDIVVTEGFAGNIALKTAEGVARQIAYHIQQEIKKSFITKLGYLFARKAFNSVKEKMDSRHANGGVFLGVKGIVVKSHGGSDSMSFAAAIELARRMVYNNLLTRITSDFETLRAKDTPIMNPKQEG